MLPYGLPNVPWSDRTIELPYCRIVVPSSGRMTIYLRPTAPSKNVTIEKPHRPITIPSSNRNIERPYCRDTMQFSNRAVEQPHRPINVYLSGRTVGRRFRRQNEQLFAFLNRVPGICQSPRRPHFIFLLLPILSCASYSQFLSCLDNLSLFCRNIMFLTK